MKFLGLLLISAASVSFGVSYCGQIKRRLAELQELIYSLELMESELHTNNTPLPELVRLLAHSEYTKVRSFYERLLSGLADLGEIPFARLWGQAVIKELGVLGNRDREVLMQLGNHLGRYELPQQLRALQDCRKTLLASLEDARDRCPNQLKLGMGLAASAGILFWIVWA